VYIGESDNVIRRIADHDAKKEFWNDVLIFVSKDSNLTKAHVRWLEGKLYSLADSAKRCTLENGKGSLEDQFELPEADIADLTEFITQVQILSSVFGLRVFEGSSGGKPPLRMPSSPTVAGTGTTAPESIETTVPVEAELASAAPAGWIVTLSYSGDGFSAICRVSSGGDFVVLCGSEMRRHEAESLTPTYKNLRKTLIEHGIVKDGIFVQDFSFQSPSAAAQSVSGQPVSGPKVWKVEGSAMTYAEWEALSVASVKET
jgi:hypothetical protein